MIRLREKYNKTNLGKRTNQMKIEKYYALKTNFEGQWIGVTNPN